MERNIDHYIDSLIPARDDFFGAMEEAAHKDNIPIMEPAAMEVMLQFLRVMKPKKVLEVGTAIGYSALRMAQALPETEIITLERDEERAVQANEYIKKAGASDRITVVEGDALELADLTVRKGPYDAIFIDAAKGQYERFFSIYSGLLEEEGCIFSDNVLFRGLVAQEDTDTHPRRFRNMIKRMRSYNENLMARKEFVTTIIPVGDGLAISRKVIE